MSSFMQKVKERFGGRKLEKMTDLEEFGLAIYMQDTLAYRNEHAKAALDLFEKGKYVEFMDISNRMVVESAMSWYTAGSKSFSDRVLRGWYGIWEHWSTLKRDFQGNYDDYDFLTLAEGHARKAYRVLSKSFFTEHVLPQKPIVIQTLGGKKGPPLIPSHVGASMEDEE